MTTSHTPRTISTAPRLPWGADPSRGRLMYQPTSRRIKGAGREGRQYEAVVREGYLHVAAGNPEYVITMPSGETIYTSSDAWAGPKADLAAVAAAAVELAARAGWMLDRDDARVMAEMYAERRDSVAVRNLRQLAMRAGSGGNAIHKLFRVSRREVTRWRNGEWEIPADVAAKIAAILG